jgi:hypothetical protein
MSAAASMRKLWSISIGRRELARYERSHTEHWRPLRCGPRRDGWIWRSFALTRKRAAS